MVGFTGCYSITVPYGNFQNDNNKSVFDRQDIQDLSGWNSKRGLVQDFFHPFVENIHTVKLKTFCGRKHFLEVSNDSKY